MQVASYMRAVLRTIAQFHSHGLLHRDIKPGTHPYICMHVHKMHMASSS